MDKINMDGSSSTKKVALTDAEVLRKALALKSFEYEIEAYSNRAIVRVRKSGGTTMFLARGGDDLFWLNGISDKKEDRGDWALYTVRFNGQEVEVDL